MSNVDIPVVIIGAGPAGLTAAKVLTELDIDYMLLSREKVPGENKACAGFIPSSALREFGISTLTGAHPVTTVRMKFPRQDMKTVDFGSKVGANVSRADLGMTMLKYVGAGSGEMRLQTEVGRVSIKQSGCELTLHKQGQSEKLTSEIVIDASGANPVSLKTVKLRKRLPDHLMGYTAQYQMRRPSSIGTLNGVNDFYYGGGFSPTGYAWVFPRGNDIAVGTGGLLKLFKEEGKSMFDYLDHLISHDDSAKATLENAEVIKRESALVPLAGIVQPSFTDRLMLAGDAAGHCCPITGEGIHYSMIAGKKAAQIAAHAVKKRDYSAEMLSKYEKNWTKAIGSNLKWGLWLQQRMVGSSSGGLGTSLMGSDRSRKLIAEMLVGARSVRTTLLAAAPTYVAKKMQRKLRHLVPH
ncbi:MAG: NAD(P)/FAD-dependent oxidoreductase [Candidatus Thorarchaeota archaeon]